MKIISILLFSVISIYAISLREAVVKTLDTNHDILSEKLNVEAYQKYVDEEEGDYYPTLDLEAYAEDSRTRSDRDNVPTDVSYGHKDGWYASLEFEQILYDGGLTPSEVEEYRHNYLSNKFRSMMRVDEIVRDTVNNYLTLSMQQELLDLTRLGLIIHEEYLGLAKEKEEVSGEILESFQVNSKKHFLQNQFFTQEMTQIEATNRLTELTSFEHFGNICRPLMNTELIPSTLNEAIEDALKKNFRILQAVEDIKKQRENIIQANAAYLPTLKFQWKGSLDDDLAYPENGRQDISRFRLLLEWNLYEGGKTKDSKQREVLFLQEKQKVLDTVVNEVTQEIKSLYVGYFKQLKKIENYKRYVSDNLNIKRIYIKQLADGTRTFIDILNAESEYFRSASDLVNFEYDLYRYYFDILESQGMLSYALLTSEKQVCEPFKPKEYISEINQNKEDTSELDDIDLLKALGEPVDEEAEQLEDNEISNLITGNKPVDSDVKKRVKIKKSQKKNIDKKESDTIQPVKVLPQNETLEERQEEDDKNNTSLENSSNQQEPLEVKKSEKELDDNTIQNDSKITAVEEDNENNNVESESEENKLILENETLKNELTDDEGIDNASLDESESTLEETTKEFPTGEYTINLGIFEKLDEAKLLVKQSNLEEDKFFIYQDASQTYVLYDSFSNMYDAMKVLNTLDSKIKFVNTQIEPLEKHKKIYEEHISSNR